MDKRMQSIMNDFENNKLGIDSTFQFHCTQCGACCTNREDIILTPQDLFRIAKKKNISTKDVFLRYCEGYIGPFSRFPIVVLKAIGNMKKCPFLKNRKCSIHDVKPNICAIFPLGRAVQGKNIAVRNVLSGPLIEYFFSDPGCGNNSETHTVREWLDSFGMKPDDSFFAEWSHLQLELSMKLTEAEKQVNKKSMSQLWQLVRIYLYFKYDTDQEFYPQFQENKQYLLTLMRTMPEVK
ncbi:YkgJ family cysteine cluster protein [Faecalimonas umbilicata]|nr:YkgJ family cysteine cluster protein [Faecalimonas umbilicata]